MVTASTTKLAKLEANFSKLQKDNLREKNKLKEALKKLEADDKRQKKEYDIERANERKEFVWQMIQQLGYKFDDIAIIGGCLALLKDKINKGDAIDEINACIAKYSELIKDPNVNVEDIMLVQNTASDEELSEDDLIELLDDKANTDTDRTDGQ